MDISEYLAHCESHNATTVTVMTKEEFTAVTTALTKWVGDPKQLRQMFMSKQTMRFWTAATYDSEVM